MDTKILYAREKEILNTFWQPMLLQGSETERFMNTQKSAQDILSKVIQKKEQEIVLLQDELVELNKHLIETQAGITLYNSFQRLLLEQQTIVRNLKAQAKAQNDLKGAKKLEVQYERITSELERTFSEAKKLKIPFGRRVALFL